MKIRTARHTITAILRTPKANPKISVETLRKPVQNQIEADASVHAILCKSAIESWPILRKNVRFSFIDIIEKRTGASTRLKGQIP